MALNNVPLTGQSLLVTRVPINTNFSTIDTAFQVDHVDYNTLGQGQHNRVSFPTQNPVPTPQSGIVQLYQAISAFTSQPELFFTHQLGSTAPTAAQIVEFTSAGWTNPGWTRLPSGILLRWQSGIGFGGNSSVTVNLNTPISPGSPNFTAILTILLTTIDTSSSYNNIIGISNITVPNFTASKFGGSNPPSSVTIAYLAIGF